jgi:hypothetical protein
MKDKSRFGNFVYYPAFRIYRSNTMYCPSCGTEYKIELQYCNRCGANLNTGQLMQTQTAPVSVAKPATILGAIILFLTLGGFGMLMSAAIELSRAARLDPNNITGIVIVGMLGILVTDIFLVRLLTRVINASLAAGTLTQPRRSKTLANPSVIQLPQTPPVRLQGVPSVTEGTTRFFEPAQTQPETRDRTTVDKLER